MACPLVPSPRTLLTGYELRVSWREERGGDQSVNKRMGHPQPRWEVANSVWLPYAHDIDCKTLLLAAPNRLLFRSGLTRGVRGFPRMDVFSHAEVLTESMTMEMNEIDFSHLSETCY